MVKADELDGSWVAAGDRLPRCKVERVACAEVDRVRAGKPYRSLDQRRIWRDEVEGFEQKPGLVAHLCGSSRQNPAFVKQP